MKSRTGQSRSGAAIICFVIFREASLHEYEGRSPTAKIKSTENSTLNGRVTLRNKQAVEVRIHLSILKFSFRFLAVIGWTVTEGSRLFALVKWSFR